SPGGEEPRRGTRGIALPRGLAGGQLGGLSRATGRTSHLTEPGGHPGGDADPARGSAQQHGSHRPRGAGTAALRAINQWRGGTGAGFARIRRQPALRSCPASAEGNPDSLGRRLKGEVRMEGERSERHPIDLLGEEFVARYRRGERPSVTEFARRYPEGADQVQELLQALVLMEELRPSNAADSASSERSAPLLASRQLGEYRILREVGRGGMGVVYEAEQESLGRRVALKVLAVHRLLDPAHLERFRREAKAAARLHHT